MKYKTIADASVDNSRVCMYMKFDPTAAVPLMFAGKASINGEVKSIKDVTFAEVLAWLGFTDLSNALYANTEFAKRYRTEIHHIYADQLVLNIINEVPYFFYKLDKEWKVTEDMNNLIGHFSESLKADIENILGSSFMKMYAEMVHEKMTCSLIEADYEQQKKELIDQHNAKAKEAESEKTTSET